MLPYIYGLACYDEAQTPLRSSQVWAGTEDGNPAWLRRHRPHRPSAMCSGATGSPRGSPRRVLVYTPPYDPDANRIEWLWRWTRREVTHNHHRRTFEDLQEDLRHHFQRLLAQPHAVLRQLGSPYADVPILLPSSVHAPITSSVDPPLVLAA